MQRTKHFTPICPTCTSKNILVRRRKTPQYVCQKCGTEFDINKTNITHKTAQQKADYGKQYFNPDK